MAPKGDQMKRILAATDFSTRSERALGRAVLLARANGAELLLVHVVDDDQPPQIVALEQGEATKLLEAQLRSQDFDGIPARLKVTTGDPFDGILKAAREAEADLVVMGSHRKQMLRDVFVGTTIERVVRTGPYPVLMVNSEASGSYGSVLAPVDMSTASANALRTADALGFLADVRVTVAHAFVAPGRGKLFLGDASKKRIAEYLATEQRHVNLEVGAFLSSNDFADRGWERHVREGSPSEVISAAVMTMLPDLVVIGTHGRSAIVRLLLGSVTESLMRSSEVDVLAVPPR